MNKHAVYPAHHPVALALTGLAGALRSGCEVIDALAERYEVTVQEVAPARETVTFKLPRILTA